MNISLLYFDGCPNWKTVDEHLTTLVAEGADITVRRHLVATDEEAERIGFLGSPSILVDGIDVFAELGSQVGLSCRRYRTDDGYAGAPTLRQLRAVLETP